MFPTRQKVTVYRPGVEDVWGDSVTLEPFDIACRADEKVQTVSNSIGVEVVSTVELMFRKIPDIKYSDEVEYINDTGVPIKRKPQLISPARTFSSRTVFTSVYL